VAATLFRHLWGLAKAMLEPRLDTTDFEMNHKKPRIVEVVEMPVQNAPGGSFIARVREVIKVIRAGPSSKRDHATLDSSELPLEFHKQDGK
jgi:hypothetical protein